MCSAHGREPLCIQTRKCHVLRTAPVPFYGLPAIFQHAFAPMALNVRMWPESGCVSAWQRDAAPDVGQLHRMEHTSPQSRPNRAAPPTRPLARRATAFALVFEMLAVGCDGCRRMSQHSHLGASGRWTLSSVGARLESARNWYRRTDPLTLLQDRNGIFDLPRRPGHHRATQ